MPPLRAQLQLRAPDKNGAVLHEPEWAQWPGAIAQNRQQLDSSRIELLDRPLQALAIAARRELLQQALAYTRRYLDVQLPSHETSPAGLPAIVMAGHQPQLYHPGVWYKNFALSRLADDVMAVGVNLVIDSDLCRATEIPVPTGTADNLQVTRIAFDQTGTDIPFEQRPVYDKQAFASWGERVRAALLPLIENPLVGTLWPLVRDREASEHNLGRALAQGRHTIEHQWTASAGMRHSLELPQSIVCQLETFRWFMVHILVNLASFVSVHNAALAAYRSAHRLRSSSRPVPDLVQDADGFETPFWVWSTEDPVRKHLYARKTGNELVLSDRQGTNLPLGCPDGNLAGMVDRLSSFERDGIKIRTRALTTTLFARLFLCDYFIHGIGGAKYDEVTDQIIEQFYGAAPPGFGIATATLRLPIRGAMEPPLDDREIARRLRDMRFNPDRWIRQADVPASELPKFLELREKKHRWIATPKTPEGAKARHEAIASVNAELQPLLEQPMMQLRNQLAQSAEWKRTSAILSSREFAFCLFPEEVLQQLLLDSRPSGT